MKDLIKIMLVVSGVFLINQAAQAIEIGEVPPKVELKEKLGGRLEGKPGSSEELQGKVHVLFYVDPDEKDTNNPASDALDKENFPDDKCHFFGIINMAATLMPNFAINFALKKNRNGIPRPLMCGITKRCWLTPGRLQMITVMYLPLTKKGS